jgi:BTB/POZ domain
MTTGFLYPDLVLKIDDCEYPVSRSILASRSTLFHALFQSNTSSINKKRKCEDDDDDISLDDAVQSSWDQIKVDGVDFGMVLEAFRTGVVDPKIPQKMLDYFGATDEVRHGIVVIYLFVHGDGRSYLNTGYASVDKFTESMLDRLDAMSLIQIGLGWKDIRALTNRFTQENIEIDWHVCHSQHHSVDETLLRVLITGKRNIAREFTLHQW